MKVIIYIFSFLIFVSCGNRQNDTTNDSSFLTGEAVVYSKYKWKSIKIPVIFMDGKLEQKESVKEIAKIWSLFANIEFDFYDYKNFKEWDVLKKAHFLQTSAKVSFFGSINQSVIGQRVGGISASMTLPAVTGDVVADRRVVLHEFGHLLGLGHEHQNAKSGGLFRKDMKAQLCKDFHLDEIDCSTQILGEVSESEAILSDYDEKSIMHYEFHGKYLKKGEDIEGPTFLSRSDAYYISVLYRGRFKTKAQFEEAYEQMLAQM